MPARELHGHHRLTVAMIVRNAEECIVGSLECIRQVADEIIVVDTGSNDRTRELALPRATRLLDFAWCDDFSAARNFCRDHASGNWVFWLDAGETLTPAAARSLRELIDSQADERTAFFTMIQVPPGPLQAIGEQAARLRLMPNHPDLRFAGRVRESVYSKLELLNIAVQMAPFCIQRSTSEHNPLTKQAKSLRNAHLAALQIDECGLHPSPLLAIAEACVKAGQLQQGFDFYVEALKLTPRDSTFALEAYYGILAALDQVPTALEKQIALCNEALQVFPFDAQLLCAMGNYLQRQGRLDLACRSFEAAALFGQVNPETWHLIDLGSVATSCHARCQELLGQVDAAIATLGDAQSRFPESVRLRWQLLDVYVRHNRRKEALDAVTQLATDNQHREALRTAVRGACLAANGDWTAALAYLQGAFAAACRDEFCLRWLAMASIESGDLDSAQRTLDAWVEARGNQFERQRLQVKLNHRRLAITPPLTTEPDLRLDAQAHHAKRPVSLAHSPIRR
jgi:glycosyltransferase involved in cell wall biosynthesis